MTQAENPNTTNLSGGAVRVPNRRSFIGGSDARIIMGQDEKALIRLWEENRGEVGPEDLSGELIVQLGLATEDLNRQWYERNTGRAITDVQSGGPMWGRCPDPLSLPLRLRPSYRR